MPSGYEKSPDYGGPPPGRLWILAAIVLGVLGAIGLAAAINSLAP